MFGHTDAVLLIKESIVSNGKFSYLLPVGLGYSVILLIAKKAL